jgi:hypothetical protein
MFYRTMANATSRWSLTAQVGVRFHANPSGIFGGQIGTGTGFCKSTSVFRQCHSINNPYPFLQMSLTDAP